MTRRRASLGVVAGAVLAALPRDALAQWRPAGLAGVAVQRLVPDRANDGVLYATGAAAGGGTGGRTALFRSLDAGRSWFGLERGLPAGFVPTAFAMSPDAGRIGLVAGTDGLYRTTDAGVTWRKIPGSLPPITALFFDPAAPRYALAGTELGGNYRSENGGATWHIASRGLGRDRYGVTPGAIAFAQHPRDAKQLLMATNGFAGVYRSQDGGSSWRAASGVPTGAVLSLAYVGGEGEACFALQERAVLRSTDGGAVWQPLSGGPTGPDLTALTVEPVARREVYVAAARGSLYRSTNAGASWVELPALPRPVRAIAWWGPTTLSALPTLGAAAAEGVQQLALRPTLPASTEPGSNRQYFTETGHNVRETFLPFFRARGALDRFGPPRTEELSEDGVLVQYFQRARLEHRPEFRGTAYEVQISLLGEQLLGAARPGPIEPFESSADQRYFVETGHSASFAFLRAFNARGGIDTFGFPITEEVQEGGRPVQYFQRARLEYRAELAGRADEVVVGAIGDELLKRKGWLE